jgi:UDP-glucose 4-epimerase
MRILLTGATGFIGSRLLEELEKQEHDVTCLIRYTAGGRYSFQDRKGVLFADLRDSESVAHAVRTANPEIIIHLAAQSAVSYSFINPIDVFTVNTRGTIALADAASRLDNFKLFIHASTSEVYGNQRDYPIRESAPLSATSPYAVSKIAAEEYLRVKKESYGFPILIMRPFNTYGRGLIKNKHFVVERAITQALVDRHIKLHNSAPFRDLVFREDHVRAYLLAVEQHESVYRGALNICTGKIFNIQQMADEVARTVNEQADRREVKVSFSEQPDRPHDIFILHGDPSLAEAALGFKAEWSFKDGLCQAVQEWRQALGA